MAKKAAGPASMAGEIREALKANPSLTSAEMQKMITDKYAGYVINKNSFNVAFYTERKRLGGGSRPRAKKSFGQFVRSGLKGHAGDLFNGKGTNKPRGIFANNVANIDAIKAAAALTELCGSFDGAREALKQLEAIQIAG